MASRYGGCYLDIPRWDGVMQDYKVEFSTRNAKKKQARLVAL